MEAGIECWWGNVTIPLTYNGPQEPDSQCSSKCNVNGDYVDGSLFDGLGCGGLSLLDMYQLKTTNPILGL